MIKSFTEMMNVDVSQYVKTRDDKETGKDKKPIKYLPWSACLKLLHEHGAQDVVFYPIPGSDGHTLRRTSREFVNKYEKVNQCYEVVVHIKVDDLEWDVIYPVMNGNNPVSDDTMSQLRVSNAVRRAFVKGIAERIGLGFSLWLDDDDEAAPADDVEDLNRHSLAKCKQRMQELITAKINSGLPFSVIADRLGRSEDEVRHMMSWYGTLQSMEKAIWEMTP